MTWPYPTLLLPTMSSHLPLRYLHLPHPRPPLPLVPLAKVRLRPGPSPSSCLPTLPSRRGPRSTSQILQYTCHSSESINVPGGLLCLCLFSNLLELNLGDVSLLGFPQFWCNLVLCSVFLTKRFSQVDRIGDLAGSFTGTDIGGHRIWCERRSIRSCGVALRK